MRETYFQAQPLRVQKQILALHNPYLVEPVDPKKGQKALNWANGFVYAVTHLDAERMPNENTPLETIEGFKHGIWWREVWDEDATSVPAG